MINAVRQVAEGVERDPVAAAPRVAQHPAHVGRVAPGPQRLLAPEPGLHQHPAHRRRARSCGSTCRRTRTRCATTVARCLRSTGYINLVIATKQPAAAVAGDGRGQGPCRRGRVDLALGVDRRRHRPGRRDGRCRHDADERDPRRDRAAGRGCAGPAPADGQRDGPDARSNRADRTRTRCETEPFNALFTADKPVVFSFHGYPSAIHQLISARSNPTRFHVRGYVEEGTTTTPFDMLIRNGGEPLPAGDRGDPAQRPGRDARGSPGGGPLPAHDRGAPPVHPRARPGLGGHHLLALAPGLTAPFAAPCASSS